MNNIDFNQKIYQPYNDAWKAIKILQRTHEDPEAFNEYMNKVQEFEDTYKGNPFAELIRTRILLRSDDLIAIMNGDLPDATEEV